MNLQPTIKNRKIKSTEEQWTACYCRLSCDDDLDGDSNSIRNQKMLLQKYADENHLRNVRFYVDDGFSGSNFERPDFKRMMSDVEDGKISTVVVKDMSRFGRDHILVGYYTKYYLAEADVRFIAIYDQVDSEKNPDDDITPFKNILNEMYAKDCSKKIKAVFKAKGNSGKHLASVPPLGYKKDPENKEKWIIDEKGAETVREIFKLCVQGFGPTQIARILTERGIDTPAVYLHKNGLPTALKLNERSNIWSPTSISHILADVSYLGHTVNFKFNKKSYKSSRRIPTKKEDWIIFEDTQEAIVDKQTFETVQKIRQAKRRPTDMGEMSPLSGLVYCADCGKKMYLCRCSTTKQKEFFNCSSYRKQLKKTCTSHHITVEALAVLIQDDLRRTIYFAQQQREMFLQTLRKNAATRTEKELKEYSKEIKTSEERIERLDKIIESLYEDKVEGKISEERYLKMSDTYETEQAELKERVKMLRSEIAKAKEDDDKILDFMMLIYKYNSFEELTPEILRAFIEKVVVHERTKVDGHYRQTVEIFYNFVGAIDRPIWGDELTDEDD